MGDNNTRGFAETEPTNHAVVALPLVPNVDGLDDPNDWKVGGTPKILGFGASLATGGVGAAVDIGLLGCWRSGCCAHNWWLRGLFGRVGGFGACLAVGGLGAANAIGGLGTAVAVGVSFDVGGFAAVIAVGGSGVALTSGADKNGELVEDGTDDVNANGFGAGVSCLGASTD